MSQPTKGDYEKLRSTVVEVEKVVEINKHEIKVLREELHEYRCIRQDYAILKQRFDDQQKHFEQWHAWAKILVPSFLGVICSLIVGLVLIILRKTP